MPTTVHGTPLVLEAGRPTTFILEDLFASPSVVTYQPDGDSRLNWRIVNTADDDLYNIQVEVTNGTLSISADNTDNQVFKIEVWYFQDAEGTVLADDIYAFNISSVIPARRRIDEVILKVNDEGGVPLWGIDDSYELPRIAYFSPPESAPEATLSVSAGDVIVSTLTDNLGGTRSFITAKSDNANARVTYGPYTFPLSVRPPVAGFSDTAAFPNILYLAPGGNIIIQPRSVLNAIPEKYKENLSLGNITYDIRQGSEIIRAVTGAGNDFPQLYIGRAGGRTAMATGNYTAVIYVQDSATNTTRYAMRFYVKVMGLTGRDPKNPFPRFIDVPIADPTATRTVEAPFNPAPPQNQLYQNTPFPPPVRDNQLTERFFTGTFPDRPSGAVITALVGKIDQEGTATTIGLADPRRQEKVRPQLLEGSIYEVARELPDDFYVNWPHPVIREEG